MKKAAWFLPSFLEGSGGHRTILQNAVYLAEYGGYECDLYVENDGSVSSNKELRNRAEKFFGKCNGCNFNLGYELKTEYDLYFATAWFTAKVVRDIPSKSPKIYFIQDFEALFNPMGDGYLMACNSYRYGLHPITIGKWLSHKMRAEYGQLSQYFDFCSDHTIYKKLDNVEKENAICFIYQPEKPRRCSYIGIEALGIVKAQRPDVKIYLYGSRKKGNVWFEHENLEILSLPKCNELYNKCKLGLCISSSNPSRIPFEMMTAGLPVVDLYMENNIYDMPHDAISLAQYTPESVAKAIIKILDNKDLQNSMSLAGQDFMKDKSIEYGFKQFLNAVKCIENNDLNNIEIIKQIYNKEPVVSDIYLPSNTNMLNPSLNNATGIIGVLKRNSVLRSSKIVRSLWNLYKDYIKP